MTIGKVIDHIIQEHNEAINNRWIEKPMAYAIYQTWKWIDAKEKPRKKENDNADCD